MSEPLKDVHTRHCCASHGCKYFDQDCTVTTGKAPQEHPCELCGFESERKGILDKAGGMVLLDAALVLLLTANERLGKVESLTEVIQRIEQIRKDGLPELEDFIHFGSN